MIYFVGIHHKPGMAPLDSKTYTGKIVDEIIGQIGESTKTNLIDGFEVPKNISTHAYRWHTQNTLKDGDRVVLLGALVQKHFAWNFSGTGKVRFIAVAHPSAFQVRKNKAAYIQEVVNAINQ